MYDLNQPTDEILTFLVLKYYQKSGVVKFSGRDNNLRPILVFDFEKSNMTNDAEILKTLNGYIYY